MESDCWSTPVALLQPDTLNDGLTFAPKKFRRFGKARDVMDDLVVNVNFLDQAIGGVL